MSIESNQQTNRIYYPSGGLLLWFILSIELLTFIPALLVFFHSYALQPDVFARSATQLSGPIGFINTIILLSGGWFMVETIQAVRADHYRRAKLFSRLTFGTGILFLLVKGLEYWQKLQVGFDLHHDEFFTFYWLITGFHYIHVLVATILLLIALVQIQKRVYTASNYADLESIGVFWHMCDLIWILVFPSLYLLV